MKILKKFLIIVGILGIVPSCTDYLDVVPDNTITLEDLFKQKTEAKDALAKVYSYLPDVSNVQNTLWTAGDEYIGRLDYNNNPGQLKGIRIVRGLQSASNPLLGLWSGTAAGQPLYEGIRHANIFLANIDNVPDMDDIEKNSWKAQVMFLKAYYHFLLLQRYGPIVIADEPITPDAEKEELFQRRSKVEDCFDYIIQLLDEAIPQLYDRIGIADLGQIDKAGALAIKARVMLFRASPFFNGNIEYFGDFSNQAGEPYFPLDYEKEKWKDAIDAINEAIVSCESNGVQLYTYDDKFYPFDKEDSELNQEGLKTHYDLRMVIADPWNTELIWGFSNINYYGQGDLAHASNMRLPVSGYPGATGTTDDPNYSWQWLGATYRMAERYYTKNGVPIDEDQTFYLSGKWELTKVPEDEDTQESLTMRGIMQPGAETIELYLNREPRFYANLGITGGYWRTQKTRIRTSMYANRDGGRSHQTDYYPSGIAIKKFVHPESESSAWQRQIKFPYPIIRLADLYLMKAEALNEYLDAPTQEVYDALNLVRRRAGIPDIEEVWSNANIVKSVNKHKDKLGMRGIILQERGIELAFEGSRFWDMIRHKKAPSEFSSPILGWNTDETTGNTFFTLEVLQRRKFTITDCLTPIDINETNTNSFLIQNPGW